MGRKEHYCRIIGYAWRETVHNVVGQTRGHRIARFLMAAFALAIPWFWVRFVNARSTVFSEQTRQSMIVLAALLAVATLVFIYNLFVEGPYQVAREEREKADQLRRELHPNAEYDAEWDRLTEQDHDPQRDTSADEALGYIAFREWGRDFSDAFVAFAEGKVSHPGSSFRQAALDGKITVWGILRTNKVYDKIPRQHWAKHGICDLSFNAGANGTRWTDIHGSDGEDYNGLMVCKAEIEKEWPRDG